MPLHPLQKLRRQLIPIFQKQRPHRKRPKLNRIKIRRLRVRHHPPQLPITPTVRIHILRLVRPAKKCFRRFRIILQHHRDQRSNIQIARARLLLRPRFTAFKAGYLFCNAAERSWAESASAAKTGVAAIAKIPTTNAKILTDRMATSPPRIAILNRLRPISASDKQLQQRLTS